MHLSDIHFGTENAAAVASAHAFAHSEAFDLIAITGDITSFGKRSEFEAAKAWVWSLPGEKLITPGNHDTPYLGLAARVLFPWARYRSAFGEPDLTQFDTAGLAARTFNTARGAQLRANWSKGSARMLDVGRAVKSFGSAAPGALRLVMCHHPLTEITGGPMTGEVHRGQAAVQRLVAGQCDLILSGHVHAPFFHAVEGGDGRTYSVGCGTLSTRERGTPAGFNIIEWDDSEVRVAAQSWTGSKFEPHRAWAAPRRKAR